MHQLEAAAADVQDDAILDGQTMHGTHEAVAGFLISIGDAHGDTKLLPHATCWAPCAGRWHLLHAPPGRTRLAACRPRGVVRWPTAPSPHAAGTGSRRFTGGEASHLGPLWGICSPPRAGTSAATTL